LVARGPPPPVKIHARLSYPRRLKKVLGIGQRSSWAVQLIPAFAALKLHRISKKLMAKSSPSIFRKELCDLGSCHRHLSGWLYIQQKKPSQTLPINLRQPHGGILNFMVRPLARLTGGEPASCRVLAQPYQQRVRSWGEDEGCVLETLRTFRPSNSSLSICSPHRIYSVCTATKGLKISRWV
jgi:hypothetical protein